jgi:hypothetical protein
MNFQSRLGGTGMIARPVELRSTAILSPGHRTGTLTVDSDLEFGGFQQQTYEFEFGPDAADMLIVTGDVTDPAGMTVILKLIALDGAQRHGQTLANFQVEGELENPINWQINTGLAPGDEQSFVTFDNVTNTYFVTLGVPEPGALICLAAGITLLAARFSRPRTNPRARPRRELDRSPGRLRIASPTSKRGCGGIGRRARFRFLYPQGVEVRLLSAAYDAPVFYQENGGFHLYKWAEPRMNADEVLFLSALICVHLRFSLRWSLRRDELLGGVARGEVGVAGDAVDQQDVIALAVGVADVGAAGSRQRDDLLAKLAPRACGEAVRLAVVPDDLLAPRLEIEEDEPALPEVAQRPVEALPEATRQLEKAGRNRRSE